MFAWTKIVENWGQRDSNNTHLATILSRVERDFATRLTQRGWGAKRLLDGSTNYRELSRIFEGTGRK